MTAAQLRRLRMALRHVGLPEDTDVTDLPALLRQAHRNGRTAEQDARRTRRAERRTEDHTFGDVATRMVRAAGRRAERDLGALEALREIRQAIEEQERRAVASLRSQGFSDAEIGDALGRTKQAVQQRFKRQGSLSAKPPVPKEGQ